MESLIQPISVYELQAGFLPNGLPRYFNPLCWASRLAIVHKGLPVETIPWQYQEYDKIAFSKQDLVPVIVDNNKGGRWVNDSWEIAKYLEDTYPDRRSLFGGPDGEAGVLFIQNWLWMSAGGTFMKLMMPYIFQHVPEAHKAYFRKSREALFGMPLEEFGADDSNRDEVLATFRAALEPLRAVLRDYPFLSGTEQPNYSDIYVFCLFLSACECSSTKLLEESDAMYGWRKRMFAVYDEQASKAIGYPDSL